MHPLVRVGGWCCMTPCIISMCLAWCASPNPNLPTIAPLVVAICLPACLSTLPLARALTPHLCITSLSHKPRPQPRLRTWCCSWWTAPSASRWRPSSFSTCSRWGLPIFPFASLDPFVCLCSRWAPSPFPHFLLSICSFLLVHACLISQEEVESSPPSHHPSIQLCTT